MAAVSRSGHRQSWRWALASALLAALPSAAPADDTAQPVDDVSAATAQDADGDNHEPSKFKKFAEVVKHAQHLPGLIDLYHDDQRLYAALRPADFDKPLLAPIAVASGAGAAGMAFNFDEQWIVAFRRTGDRVQFLRKNVRYTAPDDSPLAKAVAQGYRDSVLMMLEIVSDDAPDGAILVDLSKIFFSNFADFSTGSLEESKSRWYDVQAYPKNLELQVEATFNGSPVPAGSGKNGDLGFVDKRGVSLILHYGLVELPPPGYRPRLADPRLGHFVSAVKNFDSADPDSLFERRINRWRLEKSDPDAELSPPKQQLVWWIEDTVPLVYRPYVEAGILEWNKAFERLGYQNAIAVRWQGPEDDFAPEDVNYCTFRWIASPYGYAMSNLRANPITGEIVDGDILFDASWIRYWQREQAYLVGTKAAALAGGAPGDELVSPLHAAFRAARAAANRDCDACGGAGSCRYAATLQQQLAMAHALAPGGELPREAIGQVIKAVTMHEVGHSLGLRHNFRGSGRYALAELYGAQAALDDGLLGSVMDYAPLNLAGRGEQQGDYATATLGPYDYWAIEYAYKEIPPEDEAAELQRIAARSAEPQLAYGSDEDYTAAHDPRVNQYDLGAEPLEFARRRVELARQGLDDIEDRLVSDGESWQRLRPAVLVLWRQFGDAAFLASRYVGGRWVAHDVRGTPEAREPLQPVPAALQRDALRFIAEEILVDEPIPRRAELLRRMTTEQWSHWGVDSSAYEGKVGVSYFDFVAAVQEVALSELLGSGDRLRRVETNLAMSSDDERPLTLAEVFQACHEAIWGAAAADAQQGRAPQPDKTRRNLQRMHIQQLVEIVDSTEASDAKELAYQHLSGQRNDFPADARSLALAELLQLRDLLDRIATTSDAAAEPVVAAHWNACRHAIERAVQHGAD